MHKTHHEHERRSRDSGTSKRRVSELEGSFGFLTQQVKTVHKDLLAFQAKTERGSIKSTASSTRSMVDIDHLDRGLRGLRTDMPKIVGEAVREVINGKPRKK